MTDNLTALALSVALGDNPEFLSVCGAKRLSFLGDPIPDRIIERIDSIALHNALNRTKRTVEEMIAQVN